MATATARAIHPTIHDGHHLSKCPTVAILFQPKLGSLINVKARTWPGINKHGGVGRVTALYHNNDAEVATGKFVTHVDVKYVVNSGMEKKVDMIFVQEHKFEDDGDETLNRYSRRSRKTNSVTLVKEDLSRKNAKKRVVTPTSKRTKRMAGEGDRIDVTTKNKAKEETLPPGLNTNRREVMLPTVTPGQFRKKKGQVNLVSSSIEITKCVQPADNKTKRNNEEVNLKSKATCSREKPKTTKKKSFKSSKKYASAVIAEHTKSTGLTDSVQSKSLKKTCILENVYESMSTNAESFVNNVVGKKRKVESPMTNNAHESCSSSPESLELELAMKRRETRASEFTALLNGIVRRLMVDSIQIDDLRKEINVRIDSGVKQFTNLEVRSFLGKLEEENRIMVTWDTGTIYII